MRLAEVTKEVSNHLSDVSERYQVPQRFRRASDTAIDTARVAGDAARRGAHHAYRMALDNPRTSMAAGAILAAAVIGGVLWYIFGNERQQPVQRKARSRVRAGTKRGKAARQAATA